MKLEITIDFDLQKTLNEQLAPEMLQPIFQTHIRKAITNAIDKATGYNSAFQQKLQQQLTEALPHGLEASSLMKFQHVLNAALEQAVSDCHNDTIRAAFQQCINKTMPEMPTQVTVTELMQAAREGLLVDNGPFYAFMRTSIGGYHHLYLDGSENPGGSTYVRDRESQKHSAKYTISFTPEGRVYAMKMDGVNLSPAAMPSVISHFDSLLMSMYVGRTSLKADIDDHDVQHLSCEQYDD